MSNQQSTTLATAMWRGFRQKCPNCGEGKLFGKFLKVNANCQDCQEEFHHHRADDLPAYMVISVVGNIVVPATLAWEMMSSPPLWLQAAIWLPLTLFSCLALLQPTKGAIVGLQWKLGMHGFSHAKRPGSVATSTQAI